MRDLERDLGIGIGGVVRGRVSRGFASATLTVATLVVGLMAFAGSAEATTATRSSGFAYDAASGLLTQEVVEPNITALKVTTTYTYDAFGNKVAASVAGVDITTRSSSTSYDAKGRFATTITNALGQSESWTYDEKTGQPLSQTGPNGLTTTWAYDSFGRKVLETRPDGTKTAYAYEYCSALPGGSCPAGTVYRIVATPLAADGVTKNGAEAQSYYDAMGRAVTSIVESFNGLDHVRSDTVYDAFGRVEKTSRPYYLASGTPKWLTYTYDVLGRALTLTMADGSVTTNAYHGLTSSMTNPKGEVKTTVLNAQGLTASVTDPLGNVVTYAYDAFDNLIATTDPLGNVSSATYDSAGRKIAMSDPDMGGWSYSYDVLGQLKTQTDAKGQVTTLSYDLLGRVTQRVEGGMTSNWVYDTAPMGVGKLASASTDQGYSRSQFYDGLGRPSQTSITILGDTSTVSTYYDAEGRVNLIAYPSGLQAQYDYTPTGYLAGLKDATTGQVFWTANAYDAEMHLTQATAGNGVVTNQAYDANTGFLSTIQAGQGSTPTAVANYSYSFDQLGNLTARSDINQGLSESFTYDMQNRITSYAIIGGATKTVAYDALGNITSKSDIGTYSYNASGSASVRPHAVAAITPAGTGTTNTTYTYDANGNMLTGNGRTATWTSFNMVASITRGTNTVSFDYDSEHARIRQVTGSNTTLYINDPASGLKVEKVTGATGSVQWNDYLFAGGQMVGEHFKVTTGGVTTNSTRYFTLDHLGSIAVIADETGTVLERLSYDAWGKRRYPTGADDPTGSITSQTTRGFTGHEMIDDVGLVNMNGRIYDPQIGRFLSADPIVQDLSDSQSLNRYSYVRNNPLSLVDPSGFSWLSNIIKAVVAIVAVILMQYYILPALWGTTYAALTATTLTGAAATAASTTLAINAGIAGAIGGFIATGTVKGAIIGGLTAVAFYQVGSVIKDNGIGTLGAAGLHGAVGCASSVAGGGSCQSGFLAAGFSSVAGSFGNVAANDNFGGLVANTAQRAVVGGFGSVLGGGKFSNGAVTGAFGYLFNHCLHGTLCVDQSKVNSQRSWWNPRKYLPDYEGARQIAKEELAAHSGHHNDAGDAQRHADWSYRMREEIGPVTAWTAGVGHELQNVIENTADYMAHGGSLVGPLSESLMDLHNNAVGINAAASGVSINQNNLQLSIGSPPASNTGYSY